MEKINDIQRTIIHLLYSMELSKEDATGIVLLSKKYDKNKELYNWLTKNPKADAEAVFGYLFEICF